MIAPRVWKILIAVGLVVFLVPVIGTLAASLSGAIFTTTPDGSIVNENVKYNAKIEVYLDGGPGPNAPQTAAGLPDGDYYFQVTDPSGKVLLSQDPAKCREVRVSAGVIVQLLSIGQSYTVGKTTIPCSVQDAPTPPYDPNVTKGVAGPSGRHDTNQDIDHGPPAILVQLMPFFDTPNPGGVYKAWMMPVARYVANGGKPDAVPVPYKVKGVQVGYNRDPGFGPPRDQVKTDNFKVKEFFPPEITVRKFEDLNGNGIWDPGEPEIGVDELINGGGWPYNFTEPVDGGTVTNTFYTPYTHVAGIPGAYTACESHLAGWGQSAAYLDGVKLDANECVTANVIGTSGEKHTIIFGNFRYATKSGMKFEDLNGNGAKDAGEPGLPDWTITLNGTNGLGNPISKSVLTDASGSYSFSVPPGTYTVCEVLEKDWTQTYPADKCYSNITFTSGQVDTGNDFGNFSNATKSGMKFNDLNGNGAKDAGEPGLPDWTITLKGTDGMGNAVSKSTTTDANGNYSFSVPPGSYTVCEVQQTGWKQTFPKSECYNITLISRQVDSNNDFGNFGLVTVTACKLSDADGSLATTDDETPVPNWPVYLSIDGIRQLPAEYTGSNGCFTWTGLGPGHSYDVEEDVPAGWMALTPTSHDFGWPTSGAAYSFTFVNTPTQGCTPGFWKVPQHWDSWPSPWTPNGALSLMFSGVLAPPYATYTVTFSDGSTVQMGGATQVQALNFQGGSTVPGKAEILLRAAVAAVLNADSPDILYPLTSSQVIKQVNAALASQDPTIIINLAGLLDGDNNGPGGCPLH